MLTRPVPKAFRFWPPSVTRHSVFHQLPAQRRHSSASTTMNGDGDLNNSQAARPRVAFDPDPAYSGRSFAISKQADEPGIRERYRPFLLNEVHEDDDWVAQLELSTVLKMVESEIINRGQPRLRILVLYGSLRNRSVCPPSPVLSPSHTRLYLQESGRAA